MSLRETLVAAGMSPPANLPPGRFVRFPGSGKGARNLSGWCKWITSEVAVYGDWSTGLSEVWKDGPISADALREARRAMQLQRQHEAQRHAKAALTAADYLDRAHPSHHPYLRAKGFPELLAPVLEDKLLVSVWDPSPLHLISCQLIDPQGEKRFVPGSRTRGGIHKLGGPLGERVYLCEGYATGLSIREAIKLIWIDAVVLVCFSAHNLIEVAKRCPQAKVCADHDASGVGESAARATEKPWAMPPESNSDFNDMHLRAGTWAVRKLLLNL